MEFSKLARRLGLPGLLLWMLGSSVSWSSGPPNVILILVDDWGWADLALQGSDFFETPQIDRFARQSVRFTQAYAAAPICSPTRAALMTGKSPARLNMTIWHEGAVRGGSRQRRLLEASSVADLPREEVTLAELFKQRSYFTAHVGKWHLGRAAYYPETQGFDVNHGGTHWGAPASFFFPYRGRWSANDPELRYVPVGSGESGDYLTDKLTDHALRIVAARRDQPFFLNLWFHTVHTPIQGRPDIVRRFQRKAPGTIHRHVEYAAMVANLDHNVGRVLQKLDELELADETIVVLTSDNGGVDFPSGKTGNAAPTSNVPFRSGKGTLYEGGIRVPLMIRWPGVTTAGRVSDEIVTSQDLYATLVEGLLGFSRSEIPDHDGENLLEVLRDAKADLSREALYWHYPHYYARMTPASAVRAGDWKLIHFYEDDHTELYDLREDVGETSDVAAQKPERVRALRKLLDSWRIEVDAREPRPNPDWQPTSP